MKTLKKIGPKSLARVLGAVYVVIGAIMGVFFIITWLLQRESQNSIIMTLFLGLGVVLIFPFIYGAIGYIAGLAMGWLYNVVAKRTGGIEIEIE